MYGLVNRALQQLVCSQRGEHIWNEIRAKAGVEDEVFMRMDSYPDDVTHRLVAAASDVLATPADAAGALLRELQRLLRSKAVLLPGVRVTYTNAKSGETQSWMYEQGLRGYLNEQLAQTGSGSTLIPLFEGEQYAGADADGFAEGEGAAWVVAWTEDGEIGRAHV